MPECVVRSGWYEAVRSLTWRNVRRSSSRDSFRARFDPVVTILIVPRAHQAEIENPFLSQLERINSPLRQCESIRHYASANWSESIRHYASAQHQLVRGLTRRLAAREMSCIAATAARVSQVGAHVQLKSAMGKASAIFYVFFWFRRFGAWREVMIQSRRNSLQRNAHLGIFSHCPPSDSLTHDGATGH